MRNVLQTFIAGACEETHRVLKVLQSEQWDVVTSRVIKSDKDFRKDVIVLLGSRLTKNIKGSWQEGAKCKRTQPMCVTFTNASTCVVGAMPTIIINESIIGVNAAPLLSTARLEPYGVVHALFKQAEQPISLPHCNMQRELDSLWQPPTAYEACMRAKGNVEPKRDNEPVDCNLNEQVCDKTIFVISVGIGG
ncbi:hypothetical protein KIN20_004467 [Parelaphostrongylus tenuis]|uniref:Uncharacterized protein n=1 Tax=Parelaphostrongylus tenuis TaxID=148309 RepID=A0AAD5M0P5_PARTN|nr:hypothetical protein KIN20_004467 [Parelaphostrongylus tenuis]